MLDPDTCSVHRRRGLGGKLWKEMQNQGEQSTHVEDFEAGDVQDADEGGALPLGLIQSLVDP